MCFYLVNGRVDKVSKLPRYLDNFDWLNELELLLVKHSGMGIGAEVYSMTYLELWGLYQWLKHIGT